MKVLIVDDEQHVRDAIRMLVDWEKLGVERIVEAENGQDAVEQIRATHPEIMITDMIMPVMGGVDLLEWAQRHAPETKKIAVSGHDDFDLVRDTLKSGGMDYILKPIDPVQLNEALSKAADCWRREEQARKLNVERNIEMNQLRPVYRDKLLSNLVAEAGYYPSVRDVLQSEFGLGDDVRHCQAAILNLDTMERSIKNKFSSNRDLLFFTLTNICNEIVREHNRGVAFRYWNSQSEVVILYWKAFDRFKEDLYRINDGCRMSLGGRFDFGVGAVHPFPAETERSWREAQAALRNRNMLEKNTWLHEYEPLEKPHLSALHVSEYEQRFRLAVQSSKEEEIAGAVGEWMDAVNRISRITIEQMELWRHEFHVMFSQWSNDWFAEEQDDGRPSALRNQPPIPLDENGRLSLPLWRQELVRDMNRLSGMLADKLHRDKSAIYDIVKYIDQHYNHDISLQDLADRFYLSRGYISRKFKQELGVNVSDYIGRIRVEKAKLLLLNRNMKISQIAEMVGYPDEKYFSKVFKKIAGQSPVQYRSSQA